MEKKRYVAPSVRLISGLDAECQILQGSKVMMTMRVDPLQETYYYEGDENSSSDYLINF